MLLTKKQTITRLHKRLSYWSSIAYVDVYDYTLLSPLARGSVTQEEVTMPWGTMRKAKLTEGLIRDTLSRKMLQDSVELLIKQISLLANSGGGSFGPYKIGAIQNSGIPIKKKKIAKTRSEAIKRNKELVFLVYGLTLQDEIENGMHIRRIESNPSGYRSYYRSWGVSLPRNSPGIALLRWGSPIIMRIGKTLAVVLGMLLNPYSLYYDPKSAMLSDLFDRGVDYRQEFLKGLASEDCVRDTLRRSFFSKEGTPIPKFVYRTNLETGVPDKLEVPESYWCESFDGPPLPEFHFHLEYAKNFSLQYSPKEKNKWVLHVRN